MASPAREAREKAQARWPGATVHDRGRNWIRHSHPTDPRRFSLDCHIGPIHTEGLQEIDTAWVPSSEGWDWQMALNDFETRVRNIFNVGDIFQFSQGTEWLKFDPQSLSWVDENGSQNFIANKQPITAQLDDDLIRWPGAWGHGLDFSYQNQTARLQKLITINSQDSLPVPNLQGSQVWLQSEFSLSLSSGIEFWIDGAQWDRKAKTATANLVEVRDSTGTQVLWWLGQVKAWDSGEGLTTGVLEVRRQGGPTNLFVTIKVPYDWLQSAEYPVHIDPTIDTQISGTTYDGEEYNGSTWRQNGTDIDGIALGQYINNPCDGGWVFYNVAIPKDATATAAYMDLFMKYEKTAGADIDVSIHGFDEGGSPAFASDGSDRPSFRTKTTATETYTILGADYSDESWYSFNGKVDFSNIVDEIVSHADWASGDNMGFSIESEEATTHARWQVQDYGYSSTQAAKLHIEYTVGGSTISATALDGFDLGETLARIATMSASVTDGLGLGESMGRLATIRPLSTDGLTLSEALARGLLGQGAVSDGLQMGELLTLLKISRALSQDGIILSDSGSVTATLDGVVSDGMSLAEALSVTAVLVGLATDGLTLSEVMTGDLSGIIQAMAEDGLSLGDSSSTLAQLVGAVIDGTTWGDTLATTLWMMATAQDGLTLGDLVSGAIGAQLLTGAILDGIVLGDTGAINATIRVTATDGLGFSEAITALAQLAGIVTETVRMSDVTFHFQATGEVVATFTIGQGSVTFVISQPGTQAVINQPGIQA